MMNEQNALQAQIPNYGCQECGRMSQHINVGRNHWGVCTDHGTAWWIGSNLFSGWKSETEAVWAANRKILEGFRVVGFTGGGLPSAATSKEKQDGCNARNPAPSRTSDDVFAERRADFSGMFHIAHISDGYHIVQVPGPDGTPFKAWPGPFESERAASLFREDLLDAAAAGSPGDACCSSGIFEHFNLVARILACIESSDGDGLAVASRLALERPWEFNTPQSRELDDDAPF
jgi:hypothetical protein